jgi:deoxyribodipyrimidine photo-lyase
MNQQTAIWWIRRDLRLADNMALHTALQSSSRIVPLFIIDPRLTSNRFSGEKRIAFLFAGLRALDRRLRSRGSRLTIRHGNPADVLKHVMNETNASQVFAESDISPFARSRDGAIAENLPLTLVGHPTATHPNDVLKQDGNPYTVFTPFSRQWRKVVDVAPETIPSPSGLSTPDVPTDQVPDSPVLPASVPFTAGEDAGIEVLRAFTSGERAPIYQYQESRDRLDLDGTSRLSAYLRFGMISARQAIASATQAVNDAENHSDRASADVWLNELIWREFYNAILYHYPTVRKLEFKEQFRDLNWINDEDDIAAWRDAETGYPVVDACMRQLHSEGWMHNRGRMITASFLIKHLLVDWRVGEKHFMQHLIDGDPAANNGGWQWTAGTGTDAAPYFRIFNPILQSKRHDPEGTFIRTWLPELKDVPDRHIHEPWKMSLDEQNAARCEIGVDYPEPLVDHQFARKRALAAYGRG